MDPATLGMMALGSIMGGGKGDTSVSQSSSNTTSVQLSTVLSNLSPAGTNTAPVYGGASGSASSGAGGQEPTSLSPLSFPYEGTGSLTAAQNVADNAGASNVTTPSQTLMFLVLGGAAIGGLFLLMGKKKKRK